MVAAVGSSAPLLRLANASFASLAAQRRSTPYLGAGSLVGRTPAVAEADRRTLMRRLYVRSARLAADARGGRRFRAPTTTRWPTRQLVDRLLASPHYGERWARHWLDVVHFGETHGYDKDKPRPNAWPYRDYVIRAFNDDKPYAPVRRGAIGRRRAVSRRPRTASRRPASSPPARGTSSAMREVPRSEDRRPDRPQSRPRRHGHDDVRHVRSLTVHCARCHDHKFDPDHAGGLLPPAGGLRRPRSRPTGHTTSIRRAGRAVGSAVAAIKSTAADNPTRSARAS